MGLEVLRERLWLWWTCVGWYPARCEALLGAMVLRLFIVAPTLILSLLLLLPRLLIIVTFTA